MHQDYATLYHDTLFNNVIPFWEKHSIDKEYGGYFSCLGRDGKVYDTDKFQWLQLRQIWTFAMLYNQYESKEEWLDIAEHGAQFQIKYGRNEHKDWYFSLNQSGQALTNAYNIFSDCFACMAFSQLYYGTKKDQYAEIAKHTFERILRRQENPKGIYNKKTNSRPLKNFTLPMILSNLCLEMESLLDKEQVELTIQQSIKEVMVNFYDEETGLTLENMNHDGTLSDTFDGRLINPGHAIEAMWFMMDIGKRNNDLQLIEKSKDRLLKMLNYGWDSQHGGIFYLMDRLNKPLHQLEENGLDTSIGKEKFYLP